MAKYNKGRQSIPLVLQKIRIQKVFGDLVESADINKNQLTAFVKLRPSDESREYKVKVVFKPGFFPQAWLISPKELEEVDGKKPHHIYEQDDNGYTRLCVFYPKRREWNDGMYLADAFVPWIITWLSAYEYWQITGLWVYPESNDLKPKVEKE